MQNDLVFNLIAARIDQLPTLPGVALRLLKAIQEPDPNINEISRILSSDPSLTSKILKLVNSSFYSLRAPITTVDHAIKLLGLNTVKNLALSFSLITGFKKNSAKTFNFAQFWKDSLTGAIAAKLLAERIQPNLSEDAFFLGLLQNIGSLTLACCLPDQYGMAILETEKTGGNYLQAESQVFGFNHMEVGEYLTKSWGLPESFCVPIGYHHCPQNAEGTKTDCIIRTRLLHLASLYIDLFNAPDMALALGVIDHKMKGYGLSDKIDPADLGKKIQLQARDVFPVFDIELKNDRDYVVILENAKAEMSKLSVELIKELLDKNKEIDFLREQTTLDGLTSISNYKGFQECLSREMSRAVRYKSPLSLIFSDIDHFKNVNDTYGHLAGDHALKAVAVCLKRELRQSDFLARYGGEEFALILTETDLEKAFLVAERLREKVSKQNIIYKNDTISLTMSFGVASLPLEKKLSSEALIKQADDALYRAKGLGRNRCCVAGRD
jgi:diguanylate cyclase (GGDEF)-like protein